MRPIFIKFLEFVDHVEVIVCNFLGLTDLNNIFKLNLKNHDFLKLLNFYPGGAGKHIFHVSGRDCQLIYCFLQHSPLSALWAEASKIR